MIQVIKLPEHLRRTLERTVNRLKIREDIYAIGLFGSWSRGEATESSDLDLLVLSKENLKCEHVERFETADVFIDLDYFPKEFFSGIIPPGLDQKLNEMQILYDRDWSLTNIKLLMTKCYGSPERVAIRIERRILDSDIYLSRATSAFSRDDYRSAHLFSICGIEAALNVLVEITSMSFSNSRAVQRLIDSCTMLNERDLLDQFLSLSGTDKVDESSVKGKLRQFREILDEMKSAVTRNQSRLEKCHSTTRAQLAYYVNPSFIRGALARANSIAGFGDYVEAQHYLKAMVLDVLESYVPFCGIVGNVRVDCATMVRSLEVLMKKSPRESDRIIDFLDLTEIDKATAAEMIKKSRDVILTVRKQRKVLIKNHLIKG